MRNLRVKGASGKSRTPSLHPVPSFLNNHILKTESRRFCQCQQQMKTQKTHRHRNVVNTSPLDPKKKKKQKKEKLIIIIIIARAEKKKKKWLLKKKKRVFYRSHRRRGSLPFGPLALTLHR